MKIQAVKCSSIMNHLPFHLNMVRTGNHWVLPSVNTLYL